MSLRSNQGLWGVCLVNLVTESLKIDGAVLYTLAAIYLQSICFPFQIEAFSVDGSVLHTFQGDNLTTILPVTAFHPTLEFLVGGSSSGKAYLLEEPK